MLVRYDPFREMERLTQQFLGPWRGTAERPAVMPMDAYRLEDSVVVELDLPGIDPASIDLTVEKDMLTVKAERPAATGGERREWFASERAKGTFCRQLFLGQNLNTENIEARYQDGVLTVRIPLGERPRPKRIEVTTGGQQDGGVDVVDVPGDGDQEAPGGAAGPSTAERANTPEQ